MSTSVDQKPPEYKPYYHYKTLTPHSRAISCVKFSPKGTLLASSSLDGTISLTSIPSLTPLSLLSGHTLGVCDLAWSPTDSHYLCSASDDTTIRIWDTREGSKDDSCVKILRGHTHYVFCVNFNPASDLIVSGSFDETIRIWEAKTGRALHVIKAHNFPVTSVHFNRNTNDDDGSSNSVLLLSGSHDGTCKLWDASTGTLSKVLVNDRHVGVSFARFSPNGKKILLATLDNTLRLANISGKTIKTYQGHTNKVYCITPTFSMTNGKYIVSGSEDHCVYIWDLHGKIMQKLEGHNDTVISVACHSELNMIASAGLDNDRTIRIWIQDA